MDRNGIVRKSEVYVRELYQTHFKPEFTYHNLAHAEQVVKAALQISEQYPLQIKEAEAVLVAAWFHDTGYLVGCNKHEEKSAEIAISYLKNEHSDYGLIHKVEECILATKIFKKSPSLIAKIVSDADLFHLGTPDFWEKNMQMKKEMENRSGKKIPEIKWHRSAIRLLKKHQFETDYCRKLLQDGKNSNINKLQKWLDKNAENISGV